jgi:hypothetical protein
MTDEQILEIAKTMDFHYSQTANVIHFARLIQAEQREADAVFCERYMGGDGELNDYWLHGITAAIRSGK